MIIDGQEVRFAVYRCRSLAFASLAQCVKPSAVMLGDDGCYWVATMADCARLERAGYEWAN